MKLKAKQRHRSTNLELLGGVALDTLRTLREIAAQADLPLERVFRDVVAIGVSVVSDPDESPYQSLIAFRAGLSQKQAELSNARIKAEPESQAGRPTGDGSFPSQGANLPLPDPDTFSSGTAQAIEDRLEPALERSGQLSPVEEDSGLLSPDGETSVRGVLTVA